MFVVCGEALWDFYAAEADGGLAFDARMGGSPFNVAIGLARLGQDAALFTKLSTDRLGERLHAALRREGVSDRALGRTDRLTTISLVDVGPDGSPTYTFYGEGAADRFVEASDLPTFDAGVWGLHAGSFSIVAEPVGTTLLSLLKREAGQRLITFDPNVRLSVEPDPARWCARAEAFVAFSDLVKVSAEDLDLLYPGAATSEVARRWREAGAALTIVTRGGDGAEAHGGFGQAAVPGMAVTVADTVGAGDSFMAALICALAEQGFVTRERLEALQRADVADLLAFAGRAAAITCTRRGADLPRRNALGATPRKPA